MAKPVLFNGVTDNFGPAPGYEEMMGNLYCFRNGAVVVSAWELTPEELAEVVATGTVFVGVMSGTNVYPTFVGSEETCKEVASDTGKVW